MNKTIRKFPTLKEFIKQNNIGIQSNLELLFNKFLISDNYVAIYYICSNNKQTNSVYPYNIYIINSNYYDKNKLHSIKDVGVLGFALIQNWFVV